MFDRTLRSAELNGRPDIRATAHGIADRAETDEHHGPGCGFRNGGVDGRDAQRARTRNDAGQGKAADVEHGSAADQREQVRAAELRKAERGSADVQLGKDVGAEADLCRLCGAAENAGHIVIRNLVAERARALKVAWRCGVDGEGRIARTGQFEEERGGGCWNRGKARCSGNRCKNERFYFHDSRNPKLHSEPGDRAQVTSW